MPESIFYPITPLVGFKDPRDILIEQPTFLGAEALFMLLAALGVCDAVFRRGGLTNPRRGGLTFTACLVGGASVELLTVLHTEVGNFYHSQASVMLLGLREPLYMLLGCYGWIGYCTQMTARRLGDEPLVEAAFAALLGSEAWALLDTVGAQFQWSATEWLGYG